MTFDTLDRTALRALLNELEQEYRAHCRRGLSLDITRGKPSITQLELSDGLEQALGGDFIASDGSDVRGYGGLDGLPEAKSIGAELLGIAPEHIIVGGNSSLTLMYLFLMHASHYGPRADASPWRDDAQGAKFICPVPGYDRHFAICEDLNIKMIPVALTGDGPDMDQVEELVAQDRSIKGMWCVPKYSNPSGETYSPDTVRRIAALAKRTGDEFCVMWDNAYSVHHLAEPVALENVVDAARKSGTVESIVLFGSTSKITYAGAGLAFMAGGEKTLAAFRRRLGVLTIGPDKVNQLRHVRFLQEIGGIDSLMQRHRDVLKPKFDCVEKRLSDGLGNLGIASWTQPSGGYFISFDTLPGLAREVIQLASDAGLKLTPAGAAFPYGHDAHDRNIRIAPSYPALSDIDQAMQIFVTCVKLASARRELERNKE